MSHLDVRSLLDENTTIGSILCGERHTQGKTIEDVSADLKIRPEVLAKIEANSIAELDRPEVVAGLIRSYARYLGFDPKEVSDIYRERHGLQKPEIDPRRGGSKSVKNQSLKSGKELNFQFRQNQSQSSGFFDVASALSGGATALMPILFTLSVIGLVGYFGFRFFGSFQRIEIASQDAGVETASPDLVVTDVSVSQGPEVDATLVNYEELYSRQALNVPVVEPRDGPISALATGQAQGSQDGASGNIGSSGGTDTGTPVVSVGPMAPVLELLPLGEVWVQVSTEDGSKVFESLLKPGQTAKIPLEGDIKLLKAGNATELYVRLNGQIYGPIGQDGANVVRSVPMLPTEIESVYQPIEQGRMAELLEVEKSYLAELSPQ